MIKTLTPHPTQIPHLVHCCVYTYLAHSLELTVLKIHTRFFWNRFFCLLCFHHFPHCRLVHSTVVSQERAMILLFHQFQRKSSHILTPAAMATQFIAGTHKFHGYLFTRVRSITEKDRHRYSESDDMNTRSTAKLKCSQ